MLVSILEAVGLITSILTLLTVAVLTWQSWSVAKQTEIANSIAAATVLNHWISGLRQVYIVFLQHPGLRAYFYDGKAYPSHGSERERVTTVAELIADVLEAGLITNRLVPSTESLEDWTNYFRYMLAMSPTMKELFCATPIGGLGSTD